MLEFMIVWLELIRNKHITNSFPFVLNCYHSILYMYDFEWTMPFVICFGLYKRFFSYFIDFIRSGGTLLARTLCVLRLVTIEIIFTRAGFKGSNSSLLRQVVAYTENEWMVPKASLDGTKPLYSIA